jgi:hypothetical protein
MKTKPFIKLWTPWRVSKIIRELKSSRFKDFLCPASPTFFDLWSNHYLEIRELARAHFPKETSDSDTEAQFATLFGYCPEGNYTTRLQFLQLELNRLKSNDKSPH